MHKFVQFLYSGKLYMKICILEICDSLNNLFTNGNPKKSKGNDSYNDVILFCLKQNVID